jgi:hypothetical protein
LREKGAGRPKGKGEGDQEREKRKVPRINHAENPVEKILLFL